MVDIVIARLKHVEWMYQLEMALQKKSIILDVGSYDDCDLGKWLYNEALRQYADISEIVQLETCHKAFHNAANKVVKWHNSPSISSRLDAQAQVDFEDAQRMSKDVIYLLTMVEFKLLKSYEPFEEKKWLIGVINNPLKSIANIVKKWK